MKRGENFPYASGRKGIKAAVLKDAQSILGTSSYLSPEPSQGSGDPFICSGWKWRVAAERAGRWRETGTLAAT